MDIVINVYKNIINGWGNVIKYLNSPPRHQQLHQLNN